MDRSVLSTTYLQCFQSLIGDNLLSVSNLSKKFSLPVLWGTTGVKQVLSDVSFSIKRGETLALVGESGSGKTTIGRCLVRLLKSDEGSIDFDGVSVTTADASQLRHVRRKMQMVFQDPYSSLNPRMTVMHIVSEVLRVHSVVPFEEVSAECMRLLDVVGLAGGIAKRYPHELSGGQRQRVGIARSLAVRPSFLICDEPVSALDVSVQAQILNLLRKLQDDFELTYLFIAHDLAVVRQMAGRVAVLLHGEIVELAEGNEIFARPLHPYTRMLLDSVPGSVKRSLAVERRSNIVDKACVFYDRCPAAESRCGEQKPLLTARGAQHQVRCHLA